jgi:hypothetical protein
MLRTLSCTQKAAPFLHFLVDFNNLHIILTRFVLQFRCSIQNQNQTTATDRHRFQSIKQKLAPVR